MSSTPPGPIQPDASQPGDENPATTDPASMAPVAQPPGAPPAANAWDRQPPPPAVPPPAVAWESPEVAAGPAPGIEFAPHGARLVAYIIDGIIIAIVVTVLALIGAAVFASGATYEGNRVVSVSTPAALIATVLFVLAGVVALLYFPFFWARGGATLGMRPFNLRVVRDRDGARIGWGTAILRLIGLWIAGAVFYLGYIWIFIDKRRRGWQDLIAGTVVIRQE